MYAVCARHELAAVKAVNVDLLARGLEPANEMAG